MTITEREKTDMVRASEGLAEAALAGQARASITIIVRPDGQLYVTKTGFASDIEAAGVLELIAARIKIGMIR